MIVENLSNIKSQPIFYHIKDFIDHANCYIKLEGFNIAGSLKLKSAVRMMEMLKKRKKIKSNTVIVCSSSGNLGIALSIICKEKGYEFICVSDPNINPLSERYIRLWGGRLIKVTEPDENGGYLATRIRWIQSMLDFLKNFLQIQKLLR